MPTRTRATLPWALILSGLFGAYVISFAVTIQSSFVWMSFGQPCIHVLHWPYSTAMQSWLGAVYFPLILTLESVDDVKWMNCQLDLPGGVFHRRRNLIALGTAPFVSCLLYAGFRRFRTTRRRQRGLCPNCGYLVYFVDRCPECGRDPQPRRARRPPVEQ